MPVEHVEPLFLAASMPIEQVGGIIAIGVLGAGVVARWLRQDNANLRADNREIRASEAAAWANVRAGTDAINDIVRNLGRLADLYAASNEIKRTQFAEVERELRSLRRAVEGRKDGQAG